MKISILCVGKIKEKFFRMGIDEYTKRLGRYCKLEIIEVADEKTPDNASAHEVELIKDKVMLLWWLSLFRANSFLPKNWHRKLKIWVSRGQVISR